MFDWLTGPIRGVLAALSGRDSSRRIAAGIALGVLLGLVPKATLLAIAIGVVLCAVRVNKIAGLTVAAVVGSLAPLADAFTHKLGLKVLTLPSLQPTYAAFYDSPLGPWWGLHNSVVCGSFLVGLYLLYPVYLLSRMTIDRVRPPVVRWARRYRLGRVLTGVDITDSVGTTLGYGG